MKKLICISLVFIALLSFAACGKQDSEATIDYNNIFNDYTYEQSYDSKDNKTTSNGKSSESVDWREFLKEYENWIDEYIKLVKKQAQNPTDFSILSDYADMMTEMAEWSEKAEALENEIDDPAEALEFSKELVKLASKIAEAAY